MHKITHRRSLARELRELRAEVAKLRAHQEASDGLWATWQSRYSPQPVTRPASAMQRADTAWHLTSAS